MKNDKIKKKLLNKDYILIIQGNAVSALGDILYSVSIGYWVYQTTGSNALMGLMSSISLLVSMFLYPFTGTLIDKCNRKYIIVTMDVIRGFIMLFVGIYAYMSKLNIFMVLITAFLSSLCSVFFSPAIDTALIDIIPRDDMVQGQSIQSSVRSIINLIGKAVSGMLIVVLGVPVIILLNGVSYLLSALTEVFIDIPKNINQEQKITLLSFIQDLKDATISIRMNKYLILFIPCAIVINILGSGPSTLMMPFVLSKGFDINMYGYLMSIQTIASLICVSLLGIMKLSHRQRYYLMGCGFILSTICYILGFMINSFIFMCILFFLGSFFNVCGNALFNASFVLALPEGKKGAIMGFIQSAFIGGSAISPIIYGLLTDIFPLTIVFITGYSISLIPICYMCLSHITKEFILNN